MSGSEVQLVQEITDALQGVPSETSVWKGLAARPDAMVRSLNSAEAGGNWGPLSKAVALLKTPAGTPEWLAYIPQWQAYYEVSAAAFMGDEFGSRIYSPWHVFSNLTACMSFAAQQAKSPNADVAKALEMAMDWLAFWWLLCKLMRAPDNQILMLGMRSGGHKPLPAWNEYFYARASGNGHDAAQALAWLHAAGAAPDRSDNMIWINALEGTMRASFARAMALPAMPDFGIRLPLTVIKNADGAICAAFLGNAPPDYPWSNCNGNTPPLIGVTWDHGKASYLPADGGAHFREQFEQCLCQEKDGRLVYDSDHNKPSHQELVIPGDPASWTRMVIWKRSGSVTPQPSPPPIPPGPSPIPMIDLAAAGRLLDLLQLSHASDAFRVQAKAAIAAGDAAGAIKAVRSIGVNPGQRQAVLGVLATLGDHSA